MAFVRILLAFVIPPLAVYMQFGKSRHLAINIVLTLAGFIPGMVHAVYIMASRKPGLARRERFEEAGEREGTPSRGPEAAGRT